MDAKITKKRLSRMLSYDWLKIIGIAAAIILVWTLVFTTTATRIKKSQNFTVANYMGNYALSGGLSNSVVNALNDDVFSYEVIEVGTSDMAVEESTAVQLLQARTATDELDLMFVSTQPQASTAYTVKNEAGEDVTVQRSYLEGFVGGYFYDLHNLNGENGYFVQMANYLNAYYGDYAAENATLDTAKVEQEFRARVKKNKDKRYKKEKEIRAGVQGEIERFAKYRQALLDFIAYEEKGYVSITKTTYANIETGEDLLADKGYYSINICPETTTEDIKTNLSNIVGYPVYNEDGVRIGASALNMQVCLFDSNGKEETFRYEGLVYVCHLLKSVGA